MNDRIRSKILKFRRQNQVDPYLKNVNYFFFSFFGYNVNYNLIKEKHKITNNKKS